MSRPRAMGPALALVLLAQVWGTGEPPRAAGSAATAPDVALRLDTADDDGTAVRLSELGEGPYVVAPIFTRCRAVCSVVAKAMKSAWGDGGPQGASAQVVLVSFDPQDRPADMARFRELFGLPASWRLATLEREEGLEFFSALGFQWRTLSRRQFDHSGKIFVLTADRRIAAVLGPEQLTAERLAAEVAAAAGGASLARRLGTHWVGFFGVGVILLTLAVAVAWDRVRSRRRAMATPSRSSAVADGAG